MAEINIKLFIFNEKPVELKLEHAGEAAINLQKPLRLIVADMYRVEGETFISQGRRGGGSWKALKPDTIRRKDNTTKLYDTGDLFKSLTRSHGKHQVLNVTPTSIEFGTERPGAATHQFGYAPRNIPARPFFNFTDYDTERWKGIIRTHLIMGYASGGAGSAE